MKKNFTKVALIAAFCLAAGYTAYNSQNKNEKISDVMLDNVEALAAFEFNGQDWDDEDHWYSDIGSQWYPEKTTCTVTIKTGGGITIGPIGVEYGGKEITYHGSMIHCVSGSGNCFNGTSCIPDNYM